MTTEQIDRTPVNRDGWGPGPWDGEPDRVEFKHAGLPCLLLRGPSGAWCGYAAVAPGHALHGVDYSDGCEALAEALEKRKNEPIGENPSMAIMLACLSSSDPKPSPDICLTVHGGLMYSNSCGGSIYHVPQPGEPVDVWWFGFDCVHAGDLTPQSRKFAREHHYEYPWQEDPTDVYRDVGYVRAETERLAEQLAAVAVSS